MTFFITTTRTITGRRMSYAVLANDLQEAKYDLRTAIAADTFVHVAQTRLGMIEQHDALPDGFEAIKKCTFEGQSWAWSKLA